MPPFVAKPNPAPKSAPAPDPQAVARLQALRNMANRTAALNAEMLNLMFDLSTAIPGSPRGPAGGHP